MIAALEQKSIKNINSFLVIIKLHSWNYENQRCGALHKAWVDDWIVQDKFDGDWEIYYARVILKLQKELHKDVAQFECLKKN
jgi:hypothetical protein